MDYLSTSLISKILSRTRYSKLDDVRDALDLEQGSKLEEFIFVDFSDLDFRVPSDSPALQMNCYPKGSVPDARLGIWDEQAMTGQ